jgi:hypothetical protein
MRRFMLLTYGFEKPTPEMMTAWGAWQESVADRVVEHGGFPHGGREISRPGTKDLPLAADSITGYCIVKAETLEEAEAIAGRSPFIASIRVYEVN